VFVFTCTAKQLGDFHPHPQRGGRLSSYRGGPFFGMQKTIKLEVLGETVPREEALFEKGVGVMKIERDHQSP